MRVVKFVARATLTGAIVPQAKNYTANRDPLHSPWMRQENACQIRREGE